MAQMTQANKLCNLYVKRTYGEYYYQESSLLYKNRPMSIPILVYSWKLDNGDRQEEGQ